MKTTKLIAALLVMLGFAACEPEEENSKDMYGPPPGKYMYGVESAQFEQKPQVPDADVKAESMLTETEDEYDNENE